MEECGMSEASRVYPLVAVAFVPSIRRSSGRACPLSPAALAALRRTTFVVGARVVEPDSVRRLSLGHDDAQGAVALPAELWRNLVGVPQVHGAFLQRGVLGHGDEGDDGERPQGDAADEVELAIPLSLIHI